MSDDPIPAVCLIDDLARILRVSERTLRKRVSAGTFPIRALPSLDKRHRWSGEDVRRYLASAGGFAVVRRRA